MAIILMEMAVQLCVKYKKDSNVQSYKEKTSANL